MKLPGFVKMASTAITIALLPLAVGCTGNDARKAVEQGTREAGDRIGGAADAVTRSAAERFAVEQLKRAGVDVAGELDCRDTRGSASRPPIVVTCTGRTPSGRPVVVTARLTGDGPGFHGEFVGTVAGREVFRRRG